MSLDARAKDFLDTVTLLGGKPVNELSVAEARARKVPMIGSCEPIAELRDFNIPVRHGDIPARLYVPQHHSSSGETVEFPVIVYIHGGGWVLGELDNYDQLCSAITHRSRCIVISLAYRLAPEAPFPAAVEDCLDAVQWISQQRLTPAESDQPGWATLPEQLFLMGDSAGGNLAAVVSDVFSQHSSVNILGQVLLYPVTDSSFTQESYRRNGHGYLLTTHVMEWFWDHYCPDRSVRSDVLASPLHSSRLGELPPTYLQTCQYDPLVDEGNAYGEKLLLAGVDLEHCEVPGMIHGFMRFLNTFPQASDQLNKITHWLTQRLE